MSSVNPKVNLLVRKFVEVAAEHNEHIVDPELLLRSVSQSVATTFDEVVASMYLLTVDSPPGLVLSYYVHCPDCGYPIPGSIPVSVFRMDEERYCKTCDYAWMPRKRDLEVEFTVSPDYKDFFGKKKARLMQVG